MAIEEPDRSHLRAAQGYVELGMFLDANSELEEIDPFNRAAPEVLALRIKIYHGLNKWELMREIAARLREFEPDNVQWVISLAFATRRAVSINVARAILIKAVSKFPKEAMIYFNLACYECQSNRLDQAKEYLKQAFALESECRVAALEDSDLEPLWTSLR